MRFKIDENLPLEVVELLKKAGHDAVSVVEQNLSGGADHEIAPICQSEKRALITLDTDFADIRAYPPEQFSGLIVLRLRRQDKPYIVRALINLMPLFLREPLERYLWIVEEEGVRIRG